ncbi:hypothetical protein BT96DRAFT_946810 [Gymnopus androsaceus JB14]|uniref:Uncharacterized protein n=1 Tax=Gymnopus androsaceus JB14 TaxID=1447944 RepID=A0A6A4GUS6_9AGAR|nr:hypothetical protein BT96DRAFT_946810 [Gymnopus androsaceus JB14]
MPKRTSSKTHAETDDEFRPSTSLNKSAKATTSSASSRPHRQTIMVPYSNDQRPSTSERPSGSTAGPSGSSFSKRPAVHGAVAASTSVGSSSKPASVGLRDELGSSKIAISVDQQKLYDEHIWFLRVVILQGLPAFLNLKMRREDTEDRPSKADWVSMFKSMSPKLIAYKDKYDFPKLPSWAAAFSFRLQALCEKVLETESALLSRYRTDWFIQGSTLIQNLFADEDQNPPGLIDPIVTPHEFIKAGLLNFTQFKVSYQDTLDGIPRGQRLPSQILYETQFMVTAPPTNQPFSLHGYAADSSRFDPANDPLDANRRFRDIKPPRPRASTKDPSPPMRLIGEDYSASDIEYVGQAPPNPGKLRPALFADHRGLKPTPIDPRMAYSTSTTKIPGFDGFPKLEGGRVNTSLFDYDSIFTRGGADPKKRKDPTKVEKKSNKKGEEILMIPRPATKGVAMITERFACPGDFQDNERVRLHVNFDSLVGSMVPLQTFPSTSCTTCIKSGLQCSMPPTESNPDSPVCHPCWKSHASCSFTFPLARADEERRRLYTFCRGNNATIGAEGAALFEENAALHRMGHLDLEYDGIEFPIFQGVSRPPSPSQSRVGHLESLMDPLVPPPIPSLIKKPSSKVVSKRISPSAVPIPSSESSDSSSDAEYVNQPLDKAVEEEESEEESGDDDAVADASNGDDANGEDDENASDEEEEDNVVEVLEPESDNGTPRSPQLVKRARSVDLFEEPAPPPKKARRSLSTRRPVTSSSMVASDSSAKFIPPKQLAKQSKAVSKHKMEVVVPQTTVTQLRRQLFKKSGAHQPEGSSSKTKRK